MKQRIYEVFTTEYSRIVEATDVQNALHNFNKTTKESENPTIIAIVDKEEGKEFLQDKESECHYSVKDSNDYVPKNKACKEAQNAFRAMDRKIIPSSMVESFKETFIKAIDNINTRNKRCKDLKLSIWSPQKNEDWAITIYGVCSITLRKAQ